jgi:hypothetical protein
MFTTFWTRATFTLYYSYYGFFARFDSLSGREDVVNELGPQGSQRFIIIQVNFMAV